MRLQGRLDDGPLFDGLSAVGDVELAFTFLGGVEPRLDALALVGPLRLGDVEATALDVDGERALLDGEPVDLPTRPDRMVSTVVDRLADVGVWVELVPAGELVVKFQHGVRALLHAGSVVTLTGAAEGPATSLTLCQPVRMEVDGGGFQLSHQRFRRLASLASLRLEGASLHPDGEVKLRGGAGVGLDRVVRGGLEKASARLSDLVRRSPRFARVRSFLKT